MHCNKKSTLFPWMLTVTLTLLSTWIVAAIPAVAGGVDAAGSPVILGPEVGRALAHDVSEPLRDIVRRMGPPDNVNREIPLRVPQGRPGPPDHAQGPDPQRQGDDRPFPEAALTQAPTVNVPGLSDDDNAAVVGGRIVPPDTNGDVGPNHYFQYINLIYAVYNKAGVRLAGPFAGNAFWQGFGGPCQTNNDGDPIVLYDHLADRWFASQFSIGEGIQCVAVSTTGDPLGSYFRWSFLVSPGENNDYPKFGLMPSAYYLSLRDFPSGDGTFASAVAFDRAALLAGAASPTFIKFSLPCLSNDCPDGIQPPHLEGPSPGADAPGIFSRIWDDEFEGPLKGSDGYRLWQFSANFANPALSSFTELPYIPSGSNFDSTMCGYFQRGCVPQPSPGEGLDPVDELQMYRAQYRSFPGHDSLVMSTTVDATGTNVAGVRWAELRKVSGSWSLYQEGTYAPADGLNRWMGSIAMNGNGDIALGYSVSSSGTAPSVRYVTRCANDPLGTMPGGEMVIVAGTGVQQASANRWGDYSAMSIDPVNDSSFWYTQEYYENNGSFDFKTRIASFPAPDCGPGGGDKGQSGTETIDERVRTVTLTGFTSPVAVIGPPSFNGSHPGVTRTLNVTAGSFQHFFDEWEYLDGAHANETAGYLAVEAGPGNLGSLAKDAGSTLVGTGWLTVNFTQTFAAAPVVLTQVASSNDPVAVTTRVRNVTATSFQVRLQEEEAGDNVHADETVQWIAIAPGTTTVNGVTCIVATTGNSVTDAWSTITFSQSLVSPIFVAGAQTTNGGNTAALRHRNLGATSVEVKVEEEQSLDAEVAHISEVVGYIVIGQ